jgi:hypothetical protein
MIHMEQDYKLPITVLKTKDLKFTIGSPDPTRKPGLVQTIRQLPECYMVEVWNELKNNPDATHKAHIYMVPLPSVEWIRADGLLVNTNHTDEEEE